ncbi:hypothetical protein FS764_16550 [Agrobacterium vitis]|uniref:hypothetical protein n=1 Tax=Agrobacterium vitis TaxID=373 RepID=UPI001F21DF12|nr:hypothetical protein [Agrobacterium vitis]MCF1468519.1 hypothetical protein [Agrobacterium vitis]
MISTEDVTAIQALVSQDEDPFKSACRVVGAMAAVIEHLGGNENATRIFQGIADAIREAPLQAADPTPH